MSLTLTRAMLQPIIEQLDTLFASLKSWQQDLTQLPALMAIIEQLQGLKASIKSLKLTEALDLIELLLKISHAFEQEKLTKNSNNFSTLYLGIDELNNYLESLVENPNNKVAPEIIELLEGLVNFKPALAHNIEPPAIPVEIFAEEIAEIIEQLTQSFAQFQAAASKEAANDMQRALHTLKGSARMMGFVNIANISHGLETYWEEAIQTTQTLTEDSLAPVSASLHYFKQAQDYILACQDLVPKESLVSALAQTSKQSHLSTTSAAAKVPSTSPPTQKAVSLGEEKIKITVDLLARFSNGARSASITRAHLMQQQQQLRYKIKAYAGNVKKLTEQFEKNFFKETLLTTSGAATLAVATASNVEHQMMYEQFCELIHQIELSYAPLLSISDKIDESLHHQEKVLNELVAELAKIRLIAFSTLVPRFEQMVAKLSHELGKEVKFECIEAQGEMDRSVLEKIIVPLEHMMRNALDHGLESPAVRTELGKPKIGHLTLSLRRQGNTVLIKLTDDGAGIDIEKLKAKAIKNKIKLPANLSPQQWLQLIFLPGLSTKQEISQISGRGIGMDIASAEVKRLGGSITVSSELNQGTQFTLELPFTQSLNQALIFRVQQQFYGVLLPSLFALIRVKSSELKVALKTEQGFIYANESYGLSVLHTVLNPDAESGLTSDALMLPVLLVKSKSKRLALIIDEVIGVREVLVKALGRQLQYLPQLLGATVLGDGRVALMLDPFALPCRSVEMMHAPYSARVKQLNQAKILVVDDSASIRHTLKHLLADQCQAVQFAENGEQALTVMSSFQPDLVLMDIEMPKLDGLATLKKMAQHPPFKSTPVIMMSALTDPFYRRQALHLGAVHCLKKPFKLDETLTLIQQFFAGQR
jgi:chemosensory pili system protein ChpA (sensor histidine kinase/response regulator)